MSMKNYNFQDKAVKELTNAFRRLWDAPDDMLPLVFKAPTGSGKTYMVERFIQELKSVNGFYGDIAWIWITFSDDLAMQSREKFEDYFHPNVGRRLLTAADFSEGKLQSGDVLFINWQKLVSDKAEGRVLRRPCEKEKRKESGWYFEDVVEATHAENRTIVMIIDESHKNATDSGWRDVVRPANPKIIINVSATPKEEPRPSEINRGLAGFVEVYRKDVVDAGLIKDEIVSQTREELEAGSSEDDLDLKLLDLAIKKRDALAKEWEKAGSDVLPLILVQLPDDRKSDDAANGELKKKKDVVLEYLRNRGVGDERIANWFDSTPEKEREKLKFIAEKNSPIEFLLFKQAAGTGWDCPRAQVIVMYRDIKSPIFKTQTLGRILRNPEPDMDLRGFPSLRKGYLYTSYSRDEVTQGAQNDKDDKNILTHTAKLILSLPDDKTEAVKVHDAMMSDTIPRADYGDLGKSSEFQPVFSASMDKWFGMGADDMMDALEQKVAAKGVDISATLKKDVLVGTSFDGDKGISGGSDIDQDIGDNDVQRKFWEWTRRMLEVQTSEDSRVGNIARSESMLRQGIREWLKAALPGIGSETNRYRVFVKDAEKGEASVFLAAITQALIDYAPVRRGYVAARKMAAVKSASIPFMLKSTYSYGDQYGTFEAPHSVVQPFYLPKNYTGRKNEIDFINYLEAEASAEKIAWWFKNGDSGGDYFSLKYWNTVEKCERLFFPDWIVKFKDGRIGIFDTKSGSTAKSPEGRETGLREKIEKMNQAAGKAVFFGGLVVRINGVWQCHCGENYTYTPTKPGDGWTPFDKL